MSARGVGGVCDKPPDRVAGLGLQLENPRKEPGRASTQTLLELGFEGKNVLVGKLDSGNRSSSGGRGVCPLFAYVLDNFLNLAELIPFDECTAYRECNDQSDQDQCSGLSNADQRTADVVYDRGVDIVAELDRPDRWQWDLCGVETRGNFGECTVDLATERVEWLIDQVC